MPRLAAQRRYNGTGPGHFCTAHGRLVWGGHGVPPCASLLCTNTVLRWEPPPHVASHASQESVKLQLMGHRCVLHARFRSNPSLGHGRPPFRGCRVMCRARVCKPASHDLEHGPQTPKGPTSQSTRGAATSIRSRIKAVTAAAAIRVICEGTSSNAPRCCFAGGRDGMAARFGAGAGESSGGVLERGGR